MIARSKLLATFVLLLVLAGISVSRPARAETPGDRAVALAREGVELLRAERWEAAYDRFALAEATQHSSVFVLYMARAKRGSGALGPARELYESVAGKDLPADAPEPWRVAREQARAELRELEASLPRLRVTVRGAQPETLRVLVDSVSVPVGEPVRLDPGRHEVTASDAQGRSASAIVTLEARDELREVELVLPVPAEQAKRTPERSAVTNHDAARKAQATVWPGYVALGVGAAGVITGATTGLIVFSRTAELKSHCGGTACEPSDRARGEAVETLATVSTVSFIVGGIGLAAGVTWFLVGPKSEPSIAVTLAPTRFVAHARF